MTDVLLSAREIKSIEQLLTPSEELVSRSGEELLPSDVLRTFAELFPDAVAGVVEIDRMSGTVLQVQTFPALCGALPPRAMRAVLPATHPRRLAQVFLARL